MPCAWDVAECFGITPPREAPTMLNRSAVVIGREPAFIGWLKTTGVAAERIAEVERLRDRVVYLIPACHRGEEIDEVVEDLFEEIFRRELAAWQPVEAVWPDTADLELFTRWFTVDPVAIVDDVGRGAVADDSGGGA